MIDVKFNDNNSEQIINKENEKVAAEIVRNQAVDEIEAILLRKSQEISEIVEIEIRNTLNVPQE